MRNWKEAIGCATSASRISQPMEHVGGNSVRRWPAVGALFCGVVLFPITAAAQISVQSATDLALRNNPRVLSAEADVAKAQAVLAESHDVYVPAVTAGAGLGQGYGYLPNPPTLFTVTSGSLVYSASQNFYVRSAREGLKAAQLSLLDVRETVAQDTALAFIALDHDQQREQAIGQQTDYGNRLVQIVQQRLEAGQDTQIGLTQAKLTAAQFRLAALRAGDDTASDREHLARLIGVGSGSLRVDSAFPQTPVPLESSVSTGAYASPGVAAAFATASAKQQQAQGDARFKFRPQVNLFIQYNRYATFTNSFKTLENFSNNATGAHIRADEAAFGVQINLPFVDMTRAAKARETAAEAGKALHDAQNAQLDALDGQERARHTIAELQAQQDVAGLQQQLAQQQLDIVRMQLQSGTGDPNAPQMTPKDEVNAQISEREKYLAVIDATFQLRQAEIQLLRQRGELEKWLKAGLAGPQPVNGNLPPSPTPKP